MAPSFQLTSTSKNTNDAGWRKMHDDEAWSLQTEIYDIAASNKKHAKADELPDLWNLSRTGTLDDRVAVLRWQLM